MVRYATALLLVLATRAHAGDCTCDPPFGILRAGVGGSALDSGEDSSVVHAGLPIFVEGSLDLGRVFSIHAGIERVTSDVRYEFEEPGRYTYTVVTAGLRAGWRPMHRVLVAGGNGIMLVAEHSHTTSNTYTTSYLLADVLVTVELAHTKHLYVELFDRIELGLFGGEWPVGTLAFGIGVSVIP